MLSGGAADVLTDAGAALAGFVVLADIAAAGLKAAGLVVGVEAALEAGAARRVAHCEIVAAAREGEERQGGQGGGDKGSREAHGARGVGLEFAS